MNAIESLKIIKEGIASAMELPKCKKCGCMHESLGNIQSELGKTAPDQFIELKGEVEKSIHKMEPIEYSCMGCKHCWSADISNACDDAFPGLNGNHTNNKDLTCNNNSDELPEIGEYHVIVIGNDYPVAVSTLGNTDLADEISKIKPEGLSIVGKTETENIGIEKIVRNVLAVPSIKNLILCGIDSEGHKSGDALISLKNNGVDEKMRVIGAKGKKPILSNITKQEVDDFRSQVEVHDMINHTDLNEILGKIQELSSNSISTCKNCSCAGEHKSISPSAEIIEAEEKNPAKVNLDKAGYFVIVPKIDSNTILVEHYSNENKLLRIIKGKDARNIYWTIIENGWVTEMSHAAYLGKELTVAQMSMEKGFKYIQDMA